LRASAPRRYAPADLLGFPRGRSFLVLAPNGRPAGSASANVPHAPILVPAPKPGGGVRWLTRLDPADDAAYRDAVTPLVGRIERSLGPDVLSVRTATRGHGWTLAPWGPARRRWRSTLAAAIAGAPRGTAFLVTDVRDCYGAIGTGTIAELLGPAASSVVALLHRFRDGGVRGLPVGPFPSAVLANAALGRLDASLRAAGVRHVRWVDDVVAWGPRTDILRAARALRSATLTVGLDLHDAKTFLLDAPDDVKAVLGSRSMSTTVRPRPAAIIAAP
jgi:hypothetical protein